MTDVDATSNRRWFRFSLQRLAAAIICFAVVIALCMPIVRVAMVFSEESRITLGWFVRHCLTAHPVVGAFFLTGIGLLVGFSWRLLAAAFVTELIFFAVYFRSID
jgi:hypothetical protein